MELPKRKKATNVCLLSCSVTSAVYQEILGMDLQLFLWEYSPDGRLQQENALCHVSKATHYFLQDNKISFLHTKSPECNPIKNLWHELKHFMHTTVKPHNKEELVHAGKTDILGYSYTIKLREVVQIYRPFENGYPKSFRS